jgi:hypothetical protein
VALLLLAFPGTGSPAASTGPAGPSAALGTSAVWPVPGSFATYHVEGHGGAPDGTNGQGYSGTVTFAYGPQGIWEATCDLEHHQDAQAMRTDRMVATFASAPPSAPRAVVAGEDLEVNGLGDCHLVPLQVRVTGPIAAANDSLHSGPAWHGELDDCGCRLVSADWSQATGLLLRDSFAGFSGGHAATLLETDAPVGGQFQEPLVPAVPEGRPAPR